MAFLILKSFFCKVIQQSGMQFIFCSCIFCLNRWYIKVLTTMTTSSCRAAGCVQLNLNFKCFPCFRRCFRSSWSYNNRIGSRQCNKGRFVRIKTTCLTPRKWNVWRAFKRQRAISPPVGTVVQKKSPPRDNRLRLLLEARWWRVGKFATKKSIKRLCWVGNMVIFLRKIEKSI